jgi:hypothetical protein
MSDHTWTQEHAAAFVAGGLSAEETERLEAHVRDCPACAAAVSAARDLDRGLGELFAPGRPGPALEDRAVRSFRAGRQRRKLLTGWPKRLAAGIAATVGLTVTGYAVSRLGGPEGLPRPGLPRVVQMPGGERVDAPEMVYAGSLQRGVDQEWKATLNDGDAYQAAQTTPAQANASNKQGRNPLANASVMANQQTRAIQSLSNSFQRRSTTEQALANGDTGLQSDLPAARQNIEAAVTQDPIGVNLTRATDQSLPWFRVIDGYFDPIAKPGGVAITDGTSNAINVNSFGDANAVQRAMNGKTYYQGVAPNNGNIVATGDVRNPALGWTDFGYTVEGRTVITNFTAQFFNPATARPALPIEGRTITGDPSNSSQKPDPSKAPAGAGQPAQPAKPAAPANPEPGARRVVIRSGDIEFEVDSFDSAVATVTKLVRDINGGFVATVNSEKLPNGKVKGAVTVRVPPEHLDGLVLDLRKELGKVGELKGQRIGSQDITKQYTDLESRLKAARTMEQRLLQVIKEGKGEIKALLEAEKELGVWRTKIEEIEGELRYYSNLAALSTLTITITEKEIRAAVGITESERVQAGVEVEDVDKAYQTALAAVIEAKGRVTKSELKQLAAGQFNATLHFEVSPEAAGPIRDRLRQLGRIARLEIDRVQQAEGGTVPKDAKVKRGDTVFLVQLYNLANIAPRETATLHVASPDVSAAYAALRDAVGKTAGRVLAAQLNESDRQNVTAQIDFEVKRTHEAEVRAALDAAGEVVSRQVTRAPESDSVTDTKVLYRATLLSAARLRPREVTTLAVEVEDVNATIAVYGAQVAEVKGRQVDSQSAHEANGQMTARVVYEVPLAAAGALAEKFKTAGTVRVYQSARDPYVPDTRFATARLEVTVSNADRIVGTGVWPQVRRGLSYSASVLLTSLTWVVFGLCVVLPWAIVGYGGYRVVRRVARGPVTTAPPATPPQPLP